MKTSDPHSELKQQVVAELPALFAEHDIRATPRAGAPSRPAPGRTPDLWCDLEVDGRRVSIAVEVKGRGSMDILEEMAQLTRSDVSHPWLLVLPKLSASFREQLRARKINHADLTGTIHLRAPGIRIDATGRERAPSRQPTPRQINPFSKKASLVLRALFESPGDAIGVMELARRTALAPGWASEVTEELVARGYAATGADGIVLTDPVSALRDWSVVYDWRRNRSRTFLVPFENEEVAGQLADSLRFHKAEGWALTLIAGAQRRIGHVQYAGQTHAYVLPGTMPALDLALKSLYAEPAGSQGNLVILDPYYGPAALYGAQLVGDAPTVSDVQLFLDLARFPVRGAEAAEMLARARLAPRLGLRRAQVARLVQDLA